MNLHEHQAKALFKQYGMPVPNFLVATTAEQACAAAEQLGTDKIVVKAQVHAGGRGRFGGVRLVDTPREAADFAKMILGTRLVTNQTDAIGQQVNTVLVEEYCDISQELYVGIVIDRASQCVVLMASTEGGMELERVAQETPEKILKANLDPVLGVMPYQCRELGFSLGLQGQTLERFTQLLMKLGQLYFDKDLMQVEVNPLVVSDKGELMCLDAKITVDASALYRHKDLEQLRDETQEDDRELRAAQSGLNYVALQGNIACLVNGAGLAMATMDIIKLCGGEPANFLDVGGSATKERVIEALEILLSDTCVKGVFINIFAGIGRCDHVAEGIIDAVTRMNIQVPVVVRLEGTQAMQGRTLIDNSNLNIHAPTDLDEAARKIVACVEGD